jgi:hypothetical protein
MCYNRPLLLVIYMYTYTEFMLKITNIAVFFAEEVKTCFSLFLLIITSQMIKVRNGENPCCNISPLCGEDYPLRSSTNTEQWEFLHSPSTGLSDTTELFILV